MGLSRPRSSLREIETFRRLGMFKRYRRGEEPWPVQRSIFRIRRGRIVRVPAQWVLSLKGDHRRLYGRGSGGSGRMDWDRQRSLMKRDEVKRRRLYSSGYAFQTRQRHARADRAHLRETLRSGYEERELDELDRWDECVCDDCLGLYREDFEWRDPRWSITFLDLMR